MNPAWFSALTALSIAVFGLLAWAIRWAWRILKRTTHFLDDFFGEPARDGVPAKPGVMARLGSVEDTLGQVLAETRPDHGHSLRDVVHRTAGDVAEIKAAQESMRTRMELLETQRFGREEGSP